MDDNKLTAEERQVIRNFVIWFVIKIGSMLAIRWAITRAYRRHLTEQGIDPDDPFALAKLQAKIRTEKAAQ